MSKKWLKKCVQLLPPVISEQQEVLNYKKALDLGVDLIKGGMPFSNRLIQKLHIVLMTNARETSSAGGEYRKIQNFIGPDSNIEHAVYIPSVCCRNTSVYGKFRILHEWRGSFIIQKIQWF